MLGGMSASWASQRSRHRANPTRSRRNEAQCISSIRALLVLSRVPPRRTTSESARSAPTLSPTESRSEEHTSELQSQSNLVCRLLLEKNKQTPSDQDHGSAI